MRVHTWLINWVLGVAASLASSSTLKAADATVEPGEGTISAAIANAKTGDTIKLKAGEYRDAVKIPAGITIEGAGAGQTILIATDYAGLSIAGPNVRVIGIEVRAGGEKTTRGVSTDQSVRIERCRFIALPEAVALREAPLSDVVNCEFNDCGIGVRAIGGASPTIWGCCFRGGKTGIFVMDGGPNVRNNLFRETSVGMRLISKEPNAMVIRNNVFWTCQTTAIELKAGDMPIGFAAVRNNIFEGGGAALIGPASLTTMVSNNVVHGIPGMPFHDDAGKAVLDDAKAQTLAVDPGLKVSDANEVAVEHAEALAGKGVRECTQPEGQGGQIGLIAGCERPGCKPKEGAPGTPLRWSAPNYIANSVGEEYQCLRMWHATMGGQSMTSKGGRSFDTLEISRNGKAETVTFDITGFFCEMGLTP